MLYSFRPMPTWPYPQTLRRRSAWTFSAGWQDTMDLLANELRMIRGESVLIGAGFTEADLRRDGLPRSGARALHPGIEVSFDSPHGRLVYATDVCEKWEHNVRSIALGLQALRAVDRYGITRKGEQYAGWLQLTSNAASASRGRELVDAAGSMARALMAHHPDHGGSPADLADVLAYRDAS